MNAEFIGALDQMEKEKNISKELLLDAIESALVSAYKKDYGANAVVDVRIDRVTGDIRIFSQKTVSEEVLNPLGEISLEDARQISPAYELGDIVEEDVTPATYGRIAAQTAKQVIVQRIREAERGQVYDEFSSREKELITGTVQRIEKNNLIVEIGSLETILPLEEQANGETFRPGEKIKLYLMEVKNTTRGPKVIVSRTHPELVKRLFELEVPEIANGTVVIKSIARDAGSRTKMAVLSNDENVDAVGACVGPKGSRVNAVVDELKGEKIDIVNYSDDPVAFIKESLSPAEVISVNLEEGTNQCHVVVPDFQLSLAIGKRGQNAALAAKLTGWKIDIKSESQAEENPVEGAETDAEEE